MAARIRTLRTFTVKFSREEIAALYETVKTLAAPIDQQEALMKAYRKLEIAAYEAGREEE